jgi:HD-like signal output (HDOD) protein
VRFLPEYAVSFKYFVSRVDERENPMTPAPAGSIKEHVLRLAQKLPASPQIFSRLGHLLHDPNADMGKVVNLISIDTGLTSRVLRLSNSVLFRGREPVQSLDEAIHRVGFQQVHRMVGVAMTDQAFKDGLPPYRLSAQQIWENSVMTALAMEQVARYAEQDEHAAYTVGLLREVGKLVLSIILQKEHPGATCPDDMEVGTWERARLNISSDDASACILEAWKFPREAFLGMRHHHQPELVPTVGALGAQLHVACWIVNALGRGLKAEAHVWELTSDRLDLAGVPEKFVHDCVPQTEAAFNKLKEDLSGM